MTKIETNQANLAKCLCPHCPSYNDCAKKKDEKLFCAAEIGKSSCEFKMNGDLCVACPIYKENNFKTGYYCRRGSADEADK